MGRQTIAVLLIAVSLVETGCVSSDTVPNAKYQSAASDGPVAVFDRYLVAARAGNTEAQFLVGDSYESGRGVRRNGPAALDWYVKAAANGHPTAATDIADMIAHGDAGLLSDRRRALAWYLRGASLGSSVAMNQMAGYYRNGIFVPRDLVKAYFWLSLAVRLGFASADLRARAVGDELSPEVRTQTEAMVQAYRHEQFDVLTADLRAVAAPIDFSMTDGTFWIPAQANVQFKFPSRTR